eukprot:1956938-Prorocentrum_lima.AAC.1
MRPPLIGVGTHSDVDSLKVRKKLPVWDFGTSGLETLSLATIRNICEHWIAEMIWEISKWGDK